MNSLPPAKTVVFKTPLYPNLIRTGVIGDGSCFFHALCYSLFADYRALNLDKQTEYVARIRQDIADSLTLERYKELGGGELYRLHFITSIRNMLWRLPIDKKKWDSHILPAVSNEWKSTDLQDLLQILQAHSSEISSSRLETLAEKAEQLIWTAYKVYMRTAWVDEYCIEAILDHFRCNIYIVDSETRELYRTSMCRELYRKNVLLLWINDTHYESMGEMYHENTVRRVFTNRDKCILKLKALLSTK